MIDVMDAAPPLPRHPPTSLPAPTSLRASVASTSPSASPLRAAIADATRRAEPELLPGLLDEARLAPGQAQAAGALALRLARGVRERAAAGGREGRVQELLQEFALNSQEGVALMCLAEALLRIPDDATRDALIRDKIGTGDWRAHLGQSTSLFVNAASWGLLLTGRLVATHSDTGLGATLRRIVARGGEPLIRRAVDMAMRMMGEQFVTGETIAQALKAAQAREADGFRHSYDMLGEAAMTADDARRYRDAYADAIEAIGEASAGRGILAGPGISIKLSALHPRYVRAQRGRVMDELYPTLLGLVALARRHDIGLNIDAEESDRLELSLDLLERLCVEPSLAGWNGLGFVIQAYQKRCPAVVDLLVDLARRSGRRLMIRLVKGAYWDGEIKRAQLDGLDGYPVYTRKAHTDVAYLACARRLLAAPDAVFPQFATHNAHTLAAIHELAGPDSPPDCYEFQCLHGMGEPLYEQVVGPVTAGGLGRPCRIYAPVGTHETLLAYLVRRLLENGANTSFVNRIADATWPLETLVEDPVLTVEATAAREGALGAPHPAIPLPGALYGAARANARGLDLADETTLSMLDHALAVDTETVHAAGPMQADASAADATSAEPRSAEPMPAEAISAQAAPAAGEPAARDTPRPVTNPADRRDRVGEVLASSPADVETALRRAVDAASIWAATPPAERAEVLERAADRLESGTAPLVALLIREAGKTRAAAVAEVREAVDFLRYDARQVRRDFDAATHRPLGPVACISPWNFPLAIFVGQVAAALAAGNTVLAKPAEQTPLVAAEAVRALHAAGVPRDALQLLPGRGDTVGAALVRDVRVQAVLFTGSTEVARRLQRDLAGRLGVGGQPVPLIAETGGQNAMIVDASALPEQVVADVLASAFDSAGQRCSALRVLCVQRDVADRMLGMLEGAMCELRVGDPRALATDVGPVIDEAARVRIERHVDAMRAAGRRVVRPAPIIGETTAHGSFVAPTLIEIDALAALEGEVFGPVLHVLRFERTGLDELLASIADTGYGLTFGVHTRIDETVAQAVRASRAGNIYVNRNMVGAVVGVQPFGGEGLSGTGPKAGGPLYLLRLLAARPDDAARRTIDHTGTATTAGAAEGAAAGSARGAGAGADTGTDQGAGTGTLHGLRAAPSHHDGNDAAAASAALRALRDWARQKGLQPVAAACDRLAEVAPTCGWRALDGPTGQADLYAVLPRGAVLCLADAADDLLRQLAAVLAVGGRAVWRAEAHSLRERLPEAVRERIALARDWRSATVVYDAVLHHGDPVALERGCRSVAARGGPIVGVIGLMPGDAAVPLERLVTERSLSINTAAAGGNASLMTTG
jgi:RHH-type transcriptional regulator, proline utilization regulon repressor / proline dehydrogenase / delta 1-pyrroline-5-carboxylate dehydrogenase